MLLWHQLIAFYFKIHSFALDLNCKYLPALIKLVLEFAINNVRVLITIESGQRNILILLLSAY